MTNASSQVGFLANLGCFVLNCAEKVPILIYRGGALLDRFLPATAMHAKQSERKAAYMAACLAIDIFKVALTEEYKQKMLFL